MLAKIVADTAENEQQFAESLPIGRRVRAHYSGESRARNRAEAEKAKAANRKEQEIAARGRGPP